MVGLASSIAAVAILALMTPFHNFVGVQVFNYASGFASQWGLFAGFLLAGSVCAGLYPALVLSSHKPVTVLRGKFKHSGSGVWLRKSLVAAQFAISLFLLVGALASYRQVTFMESFPLGFKLDSSIVLNQPNVSEGQSARSAYEAFHSELIQIPGVKHAVRGISVPGNGLPGDRLRMEENANEADSYAISLIVAGYDYGAFFDLELLAGREFSRDMQTDDRAVIMNEEALRTLGIESPEAAIGKNVVNAFGETWEIIGVYKNFAQQSLQNPYIPIATRLIRDEGYIAGVGQVAIRIGNADPQSMMSQIETLYRKHFPESEFVPYFFDESYANQYQGDRQFMAIYSFFTLLGIFIAMSGLLGLSTYMIQQRRKEIAIRKVLGGSVLSNVRLVTREYVVLLSLAAVVALPSSYFWLTNWLSTFAFRFQLDLWIWLLPVTGIAALVLATILKQTITVSRANPSINLRFD